MGLQTHRVPPPQYRIRWQRKVYTKEALRHPGTLARRCSHSVVSFLTSLSLLGSVFSSHGEAFCLLYDPLPPPRPHLRCPRHNLIPRRRRRRSHSQQRPSPPSQFPRIRPHPSYPGRPTPQQAPGFTCQPRFDHTRLTALRDHHLDFCDTIIVIILDGTQSRLPRRGC